jgi:predicted house-cleaning noncanonical NTP pyrophosphatase (MazG superfamily)
MEKTTIQISQTTLGRMKNFKKFERQSYDDLLNNMLDEVEDESLSEEEIEELKIALENVKRGKVKPIEQVAKELGITLV